MTDDLLEALRDDAVHMAMRDLHGWSQRARDAADTIEALTAERDEARARWPDGPRSAQAAEPSLTMVYGAIMELRAAVDRVETRDREERAAARLKAMAIFEAVESLRAEVRDMAAAVERKATTTVFTIPAMDPPSGDIQAALAPLKRAMRDAFAQHTREGRAEPNTGTSEP